MTETVILVPGIGLGGVEFFMLVRRLRKQGYCVKIFWKNPWRGELTDNAKALYQMISSQQTAKTHLVAHSLGGLVVLQMLQDYPQQKVARVVLLGSPISGCLAARRVLRLPSGRWLLGKTLTITCTNPIAFPKECVVGSIAGRLNFLLGLFLCPHKNNDTLVCVEETLHPELTDHCVLNVTHSSMLLSRQVGSQVINFIGNGVFSH
jgi:pimeloyl-ACP methyl ester carboxylesterase